LTDQIRRDGKLANSQYQLNHLILLHDQVVGGRKGHKSMRSLGLLG